MFVEYRSRLSSSGPPRTCSGGTCSPGGAGEDPAWSEGKPGERQLLHVLLPHSSRGLQGILGK